VMFIGQVRGASCCCTESHLPVAYGALLAALRGGRRISHKLIAYLHEACAIAPAAFLLSLAIATYALLWAGLLRGCRYGHTFAGTQRSASNGASVSSARDVSIACYCMVQ